MEGSCEIHRPGANSSLRKKEMALERHIRERALTERRALSNLFYGRDKRQLNIGVRPYLSISLSIINVALISHGLVCANI